jgi:hypothetical protein
MAFFDFIKKKEKDIYSNRYQGKPFLKLVDSFVLDCIGQLDASQDALLNQMLPKLQKTFNNEGTWQEIVMRQLQFETKVKAAILELWVKNQNIAKQNGTTLEPMEFVTMFVDNNIPVNE